jgi:hypothetical protein
MFINFLLVHFKKNIAQTRKDMFEVVDQIAKGNMNYKAQLLQNILRHEQQSLMSLRAHLIKRQSLRQPPFPGCPACG